jgi:hypothetical protein
MYVPAERLTSTRGLNQGDILISAPRLKHGLAENLCTMAGKKNFNWPVPPDQVTAFSGGLRVMQAVERVDYALVISNSCDNASGISPVVLAPIQPFTFAARDDTPGKKWMRVSAAATSTSSPKYFYLPASAEIGFPRSEAQLAELYLVTPSLLAKFIALGGTQRIGALSGEAVVHLQWQVGLIFGRNPREDLAWPSADDLELKLGWLDDELAKSHNQVSLEEKQRYAEEKSTIEKQLGRPTGALTAAIPAAAAATSPISTVEAITDPAPASATVLAPSSAAEPKSVSVASPPRTRGRGGGRGQK